MDAEFIKNIQTLPSEPYYQLEDYLYFRKDNCKVKEDYHNLETILLSYISLARGMHNFGLSAILLGHLTENVYCSKKSEIEYENTVDDMLNEFFYRYQQMDNCETNNGKYSMKDIENIQKSFKKLDKNFSENKHGFMEYIFTSIMVRHFLIMAYLHLSAQFENCKRLLDTSDVFLDMISAVAWSSQEDKMYEHIFKAYVAFAWGRYHHHSDNCTTARQKILECISNFETALELCGKTETCTNNMLRQCIIFNKLQGIKVQIGVPTSANNFELSSEGITEHNIEKTQEELSALEHLYHDSKIFKRHRFEVRLNICHSVASMRKAQFLSKKSESDVPDTKALALKSLREEIKSKFKLSLKYANNAKIQLMDTSYPENQWIGKFVEYIIKKIGILNEDRDGKNAMFGNDCETASGLGEENDGKNADVLNFFVDFQATSDNSDSDESKDSDANI